MSKAALLTPGSNPAPRLWLVALLLLGATLLAYTPALTGGLLWDDDAHLTKPALRSLDGLWRIWAYPGATQQYYPLVHSAFWVQDQLWGQHTLGYHLVNVALHAVSAVLVWLILTRLRVPGALLAAAIFALHPVHVESVAWMTELKNTLSAVLYLSAMLAFFAFDPLAFTASASLDAADRESGPSRTQVRRGGLDDPPPGHRFHYALAMVLFLAALLSKTVTATLPAVLLVIAWWQHGRLSWRRHVLPMTPPLVLGAAMGLMTAYFEKYMIGALGEAFVLEPMQRLLIAGRVGWFYLAKLLWPVNLTFIYPRWHVDPAAPWQYLFPLATLLVLGLLWFGRRRIGRAPLAAALIFLGTLFPVLGFLDVYPFRFSFVADHFQYLASLPLIALAAAGIVRLAGVASGGQRPLRVASVILLLVLGVLTWNRSHVYQSSRAIWEDTLAKNDGCSMVFNNYGKLLYDGDDAAPANIEAAAANFRKAIDLDDRNDMAHRNLAQYHLHHKRYDAALAQLKQALEIDPNEQVTQYQVGMTLYASGRLEDSLLYFRNALRMDRERITRLSAAQQARQDDAQVLRDSRYVDAQGAYGRALLDLGRAAEALPHLQRAVELDGTIADDRVALGRALVELGRAAEAQAHYQAALERTSSGEVASVDAHNGMGLALLAQKQPQQAMRHFERALALRPDLAETHYNLGLAMIALDQYNDAARQFGACIKLQPDHAMAHHNLGSILFLANELPAAIAHYRRAIAALPGYLDAYVNLGQALVASNQLDDAAAAYRQAIAHQPNHPVAHLLLAQTLHRQGKLDAAVAEYRLALAQQPNWPDAMASLARLLATRPDASQEDIAHAADLAQRAAVLTQYNDPGVLDTLALALARTGRYDDARQLARRALQIAQATKRTAIVPILQSHLDRFTTNQPWPDLVGP
ncbi:MAG: tetratricopeptide repeat protein [Phycisphaeraceae bacterium]